MINCKFELKKNDYLSITIFDNQYKSIERISNFGWTSDHVIEDLEWLEMCREGTFIRDDGNNSFNVGFENSPGIIVVDNNVKTAELYDAYDHDKPALLSLTLDELKYFLEQLRDYLISIGK